MGANVRQRVAIVAMLLATSHAVGAQGTTTVPLGDPTYRDIDRLIDAGLVGAVIVGQRPYSRRLVQELAESARQRLDAGQAHGAGQALARAAIRRILAREGTDSSTPTTSGLRWSPGAALRAEALVSDAPSRAVPSNGLGTVEADLNTLTDRRFGRRYVTGANLALESDRWVELPGSLSLQVIPRLHLARTNGSGESSASIELLTGSVRAVRGNASLSVGREYTEWSPSEGGGLLFSRNAPPLNMVRIASDRPAVLPGVLGRLGATSATLQVAELGQSVNNSHSLLVSYKASVSPAPGLELGGMFENHFGGSGAKHFSPLDRFIDFVPFIDVFRRHPNATDVESDKLLGIDARLRIPQLANVTVFSEVQLEDFDFHRLGSIFHQDAAYNSGVIIPALTPSVSAQLTYHTAGIRFYQHHLITNGIASRRLLLGDDLGRDASGTDILVHWEHPSGASISANGAVERRRSDTYEGTDSTTGFVFRELAKGPVEWRRRAMLVAGWQPSEEHYALLIGAGAEQAANVGFVAAPRELHGVATVALTILR